MRIFSLCVVLVVGLAVGTLGTIRALDTRHPADSGQVPAAHSAPIPPTGPPPERLVPGAEPRRLILPALSIDAPIIPVTVQPNFELAVPESPQILGWWRHGASPGSPQGTVVIDGHVDSYRDGRGALFHLADLRPGATVLTVTTAGTVTYLVQAVRHYPKASLPADIFDRSGDPRLVLITCGGTFDKQSRQYADNVVAYATPTGP